MNRDPRSFVPTLVLHETTDDGSESTREIAAMPTVELHGKDARQLRGMQRQQKRKLRLDRRAQIREAKQELHDARKALLDYARERSGIVNLSWKDAEPLIAQWVAEEEAEAAGDTPDPAA